MKKLIIFGIVFLFCVSFASATFEYNGIECSTTASDYQYYNDSGSITSNIFIPLENSINQASNQKFMFDIVNFRFTAQSTNMPMILTQSDNRSTAMLLQTAADSSAGAGKWSYRDNAGYVNSGYTSAINTDYNITSIHDMALDIRNDTWSPGGVQDSKGFREDVNFDEIAIEVTAGVVTWDYMVVWNCTDNACNCPTAAPPPSKSINLSSPLPADNSQFNIQELNFNLTANSSSAFSCNLYINNTFNQTESGFSSGTNIGVDFNVSFDVLEVGNFNFIIGCTNLDNDTNTSSHTFYIDNANPTIDGEDINNSHQELNLSYSINVSDTFLFSFMMNDSCGNNFKNESVNDPFYFDESYNIETCSVGTQETNISVCDGNAGALNCVNYTYYWNKTAVVNITAYDTINGVFIDSFTINDSSKSISTTNGNVSFWQYALGNYDLTLDASGYAVTTTTVSFNDTINTYQFNLYTTNSFNFTFRNEMTEEIVNQNITVEFISDVASYNYTAENGTLYVDIITPTTYTLRYYSSTPTDYGLTREYIYRLTNRTHQDLTLWMIDDSNSTEITITVYDETTINLIENAIVYVQRYFIEGNVYRTVAMYSTDVSGKSYFDVEADNQYYKILIDFPWETRKYTSEEFYFSGSAYNVYISLLEEVAEEFFDEEGISVNIIYSNTTSRFTVTWVDSEAVATRYCLYLKKYGRYSKEVLNYSCSTSASGSIELTGFADDTVNYAIFTATINGKEKVIASSWKELVSSKLSAGAFGVFMTAVLVAMFAFMVSFHIISLILGAAALIFSKMIGILDLGWGYIFGIFFAAVILALMLRLWKR